MDSPATHDLPQRLQQYIQHHLGKSPSLLVKHLALFRELNFTWDDFFGPLVAGRYYSENDLGEMKRALEKYIAVNCSPSYGAEEAADEEMAPATPDWFKPLCQHGSFPGTFLLHWSMEELPKLQCRSPDEAKCIERQFQSTEDLLRSYYSGWPHSCSLANELFDRELQYWSGDGRCEWIALSPRVKEIITAALGSLKKEPPSSEEVKSHKETLALDSGDGLPLPETGIRKELGLIQWMLSGGYTRFVGQREHRWLSCLYFIVAAYGPTVCLFRSAVRIFQDSFKCGMDSKSEKTSRKIFALFSAMGKNFQINPMESWVQQADSMEPIGKQPKDSLLLATPSDMTECLTFLTRSLLKQSLDATVDFDALKECFKQNEEELLGMIEEMRSRKSNQIFRLVLGLSTDHFHAVAALALLPLCARRKDRYTDDLRSLACSVHEVSLPSQFKLHSPLWVRAKRLELKQQKKQKQLADGEELDEETGKINDFMEIFLSDETSHDDLNIWLREHSREALGIRAKWSLKTNVTCSDIVKVILAESTSERPLDGLDLNVESELRADSLLSAKSLYTMFFATRISRLVPRANWYKPAQRIPEQMRTPHRKTWMTARKNLRANNITVEVFNKEVDLHVNGLLQDPRCTQQMMKSLREESLTKDGGQRVTSVFLTSVVQDLSFWRPLSMPIPEAGAKGDPLGSEEKRLLTQLLLTNGVSKAGGTNGSRLYGMVHMPRSDENSALPGLLESLKPVLGRHKHKAVVLSAFFRRFSFMHGADVLEWLLPYFVDKREAVESMMKFCCGQGASEDEFGDSYFSGERILRWLLTPEAADLFEPSKWQEAPGGKEMNCVENLGSNISLRRAFEDGRIQLFTVQKPVLMLSEVSKAFQNAQEGKYDDSDTSSSPIVAATVYKRWASEIAALFLTWAARYRACDRSTALQILGNLRMVLLFRPSSLSLRDDLSTCIILAVSHLVIDHDLWSDAFHGVQGSLGRFTEALRKEEEKAREWARHDLPGHYTQKIGESVSGLINMLANSRNEPVVDSDVHASDTLEELPASNAVGALKDPKLVLLMQYFSPLIIARDEKLPSEVHDYAYSQLLEGLAKDQLRPLPTPCENVLLRAFVLPAAMFAMDIIPTATDKTWNAKAWNSTMEIFAAHPEKGFWEAKDADVREIQASFTQNYSQNQPYAARKAVTAMIKKIGDKKVYRTLLKRDMAHCQALGQWIYTEVALLQRCLRCEKVKVDEPPQYKQSFLDELRHLGIGRDGRLFSSKDEASADRAQKEQVLPETEAQSHVNAMDVEPSQTHPSPVITAPTPPRQSFEGDPPPHQSPSSEPVRKPRALRGRGDKAAPPQRKQPTRSIAQDLSAFTAFKKTAEASPKETPTTPVPKDSPMVEVDTLSNTQEENKTVENGSAAVAASKTVPQADDDTLMTETEELSNAVDTSPRAEDTQDLIMQDMTSSEGDQTNNAVSDEPDGNLSVAHHDSDKQKALEDLESLIEDGNEPGMLQWLLNHGRVEKSRLQSDKDYRAFVLGQLAEAGLPFVLVADSEEQDDEW